MPIFEVTLREKKNGRRHQWRHEFADADELQRSIDLETHELIGFRELPRGLFGMPTSTPQGYKTAGQMVYMLGFLFAVCGVIGAFESGGPLAILIACFVVAVMAIPFVWMFIRAANSLWS